MEIQQNKTLCKARSETHRITNSASRDRDKGKTKEIHAFCNEEVPQAFTWTMKVVTQVLEDSSLRLVRLKQAQHVTIQASHRRNLPHSSQCN